MKDKKNNILKILARIAKNRVERELSTMQPFCAAIYHQPKRPQKNILYLNKMNK